MFNYSDFLNNSLFCEYAYIINLDDGVLEYYTGGNRKPSDKGRYAKNKAPTPGFKYYGVKLSQEVQLADINKYKVIDDYDNPFVIGSEEEIISMDNMEVAFKDQGFYGIF